MSSAPPALDCAASDAGLTASPRGRGDESTASPPAFSRTDCWEEWYRRFASLPADRQGRRTVSATFKTKEGYSLGGWQNTQRGRYKKGMLTAQQIAKLESVGFVWDALQAGWEEGFTQFLTFPAEADGSRNVPRSHTTPDGFRLGIWLDRQRRTYRDGQLDPVRLSRLEAAGIVWDAHGTLAWAEAMDRLRAYPADASGKRLVPQDHVTDDGYPLGRWLSYQRQLHNSGAMDAAHAADLDSAGMVWEPQEGAWIEALRRFEAWPRDADGLRHVPTRYILPDGYRLGRQPAPTPPPPPLTSTPAPALTPLPNPSPAPALIPLP